MSECLRIVSLEIPVGGWSEKTTQNTSRHSFVCGFTVVIVVFTVRGLCMFFPYRHQLRHVSCSGRRSDWLGCLLRESHSDGVSCGRLKPISPRRPGPPLESAVLVSFLRWPPPPAWELVCKNTGVRRQILNNLHINQLWFCCYSDKEIRGQFVTLNLGLQLRIFFTINYFFSEAYPCLVEMMTDAQR